MAEQLLRNADIEPTAEIIAAGLGAANNVYTAFIRLWTGDTIMTAKHGFQKVNINGQQHEAQIK